MSEPRMPMTNAMFLLRCVEDALRDVLNRSDFGDPGSFAEQVLQAAMDNVTMIRQAADKAGLGFPVKQLTGPTPAQLADFTAAHAEGLHEDVPREFCPDCERH